MQVELSQDTENRYRNLARQTGKSIEECLREAAERYLEEQEEVTCATDSLEDRLDSQIIRERLQTWEEQGMPGITLEEFAHSHGYGRAK